MGGRYRCAMCGKERGWAIICQKCGFILCESCMRKVRVSSFWGGTRTPCPNCKSTNWRELK